VIVLEARNRVGGRVNSASIGNKGAIIELGAAYLYGTGPGAKYGVSYFEMDGDHS
jgi:phytoene dehydrogenase-like protein